MKKHNRRDLLRAGVTLAALPSAMLFTGCSGDTIEPEPQTKSEPETTEKETPAMTTAANETEPQLQYLEIVTSDPEPLVQLYSTSYGAKFGEPDASLGGAKIAKLAGGVTLAIRAPMHAQEEPTVRPYMLVKDIAASVKASEDAGGQVMVPPMELPGHGQCAVVMHGGVQCGLWQTKQ